MVIATTQSGCQSVTSTERHRGLEIGGSEPLGLTAIVIFVWGDHTWDWMIDDISWWCFMMILYADTNHMQPLCQVLVDLSYLQYLPKEASLWALCFLTPYECTPLPHCSAKPAFLGKLQIYSIFRSVGERLQRRKNWALAELQCHKELRRF